MFTKQKQILILRFILVAIFIQFNNNGNYNFESIGFTTIPSIADEDGSKFENFN